MVIEHAITHVIYIYIYIYINQYTTDVGNNYKISKASNLKKSYYNLIGDGVIKNHNTIYTSGDVNVTKINKLVNLMVIAISQRKKNIQII